MIYSENHHNPSNEEMCWGISTSSNIQSTAWDVHLDVEEVHHTDREQRHHIYDRKLTRFSNTLVTLMIISIESFWMTTVSRLRPLCRRWRTINLWPSVWHLLHLGYIIGVFWDILSYWINAFHWWLCNAPSDTYARIFSTQVSQAIPFEIVNWFISAACSSIWHTGEVN